MTGFYIAARSNNTWGVIDFGLKLQLRAELLLRDGPFCSKKNGHGCGHEFWPERLTVDHVIPISRGGPVTDIHNLQFLCKRCHEKKTKREMLKS